MARKNKPTFADMVSSYDIGDKQHRKNFTWSMGSEAKNYDDFHFHGNQRQTNNMMHAFREAHKAWTKAKTPEAKEKAIRKAANVYDIFETNNWHRENRQLMEEAAKSLTHG